jgi:hypothetical protein
MNTRTVESKEQQKRRGGIDPAALAAASLASAISTIAQPGPYTPVTAVLGLTILFVVLAYDIDPHRTRFQSLAYSCVAALTTTLAAGYPMELYFAASLSDRTSSAVPQLWTVFAWIAFAFIYYAVDKRARQ